MNTTQMEYILAVAEHGNITKAAEQLHISQPSLSNQIISLEKQLGIALLERKHKRVYLTEAGIAFTKYARKIIGESNDLQRLMTDFANLNTGSIRVGALPIMSSLRLPNMISEFKKEYGKVKLTILEKGSSDLLRAVENNEVDVAFAIIKGTPDENLNAVLINTSQICAVVNKKDKLSKKEKISWDMLQNVPLAMNTDSYVLQDIVSDSFFSEKKKEANVMSYCNQIETALALADQNMGVAFCTKEVADYYGYKNVVAIPLHPEIKRRVYLIYKKDIAYYPVLKAFVNFAMHYTNKK